EDDGAAAVDVSREVVAEGDLVVVGEVGPGVDGVVGLHLGDRRRAEGGIEVIHDGPAPDGGGDGSAVGGVIGLGGRVEHAEGPAGAADGYRGVEGGDRGDPGRRVVVASVDGTDGVGAIHGGLRRDRGRCYGEEEAGQEEPGEGEHST